MTGGAIVNSASPAWHVIESNKPSASLASNTCNAIPYGADAGALTNVQSPNCVVWRLRQRNGFIEVIDIRFDLRWEYGARYRGGGAFISNCYLYVPSCEVLWGFSVDLYLYVHSPSNAGTDTAPIARLPLTIGGTANSLIHSRSLRWDFVLYGDGRYTAS